jgi:outer membrane receptor protein involved in Fe transport
MRGVTSGRGRPSVAVLLDGVDLSSENVFGGGPAITSRMLDLERVEVVRGTRTVLQGRNAFAGAINYASRRPDAASRAAQLRLDAGFGGLLDLEGSVNLPLGPEGLAARVHVASHQLDGLWRNPATGGDLGGSRGLAGSASLAFGAGDAWTGWLRLGYADDESDPQAIGYGAPNARRPVPGTTLGAPGGPATPCPAGVTTAPAAARRWPARSAPTRCGCSCPRIPPPAPTSRAPRANIPSRRSSWCVAVKASASLRSAPGWTTTSASASMATFPTTRRHP